MNKGVKMLLTDSAVKARKQFNVMYSNWLKEQTRATQVKQAQPETQVQQQPQAKQQQVIKYEEVQINNLPMQDYAKAKEVIGLLDIGQYAKITVNDLSNFNKFVMLLSERQNYFLVKPDAFQNNIVTIFNTGKSKIGSINYDTFSL